MKIYLAGPMRGIAEFNFPAFHVAAAKLRKDGHEVFNPAEHAIEVYGEEAVMANQIDIRRLLGDDLEYICRHADTVALLPGWEVSKGANAERATAVALGLLIVVLAL